MLNDLIIGMAGSGGDGIVSAGESLISASAQEGYYAILTKSFGSQIRGGESSCRLRVSTTPVLNPGGALSAAVALNWEDFLRFGGELPVTAETVVIYEQKTGVAPEQIPLKVRPAIVRCVPIEQLAKESPVDADLVLPIPDSGTPAAIGFARAAGIPFSEGLIKNRYVARTFIQPDQELRRQGIRLKYHPVAEVAGKRVVAVDDSIVRGNTTREIVRMLFDAGAAEVHLRISSPPVIGQCFYGIDLASPDEMIAANASVEDVRDAIGATSLAYLSLEGLTEATRRPQNALCRACLTRRYPTAVPLDTAKHRFEAVGT